MKSFRLYFLTQLLMLPFLSSSAIERATPSAADFFCSAPAEIVSGLPEISRLDMIDYFNSGSSVKSDNRLGQKVGLTALKDELISWQDDDSVAMAMAVLPFKNDTLLMIVRTVVTPLPDSEIMFYDTSWQPTVQNVFVAPSLKDWLSVKDKKTVANAEEVLPFMLVTAVYDPDDKLLVLTNRTSDYFVESDTPEAVGLLKKELRYQWTGSSFRQLRND